MFRSSQLTPHQNHSTRAELDTGRSKFGAGQAVHSSQWFQVLSAILLFAIFYLLFSATSVFAQTCSDLVGGIDYCPTLTGTRCATYGVMPSCGTSGELTPTANTNLNCGSCTFTCESGWADCNGGIGLGTNGCETQNLVGQSCTTGAGEGGTYAGTACSPTCTATPRYVSRQYTSPGTAESGHLNVTGDIRSSSGDLYLATGKVIRVDGSGITQLYVANGGANELDEINMTVIGTLVVNRDLTAKSGLVLGGVRRTTWPEENPGLWTTGTGGAIYYSGGNVGVGTTSPSQLFEVTDATAGTARLRITDTAQNPELQLQYGTEANDHWAIYSDQGAGDMFKIWGGTSPADRLTIDEAGNVGIGTSNPGALVDVYRLEGSNPNSIRFNPTGNYLTTIGDGSINTYYANNQSTPKILKIQSNGGVSSFGGNVGIGSSPAARLSLVTSAGGGGTWSDAGILINNTGGAADDTSGESVLAFRNQMNGTNYWLTGINQNVSGGGYGIAYGDSFIVANTFLSVTPTGKVGIGTTSPSATLDVVGNLKVGGNEIANSSGETRMQDIAGSDFSAELGYLLLGTTGISCTTACSSHGLSCGAATSIRTTDGFVGSTNCSQAGGNYRYLCFCE